MATLTLAGTPRRLRLPWGAIRRLDGEQGLDLFQVVADGGAALRRPDTLTKVLWGACVTDWPDVTLAELDAALAVTDYATVVAAVVEAIVEAQGGEQRARPPVGVTPST